VTGEKGKEEPDTVTEQWHCSEIISEQKTGLKSTIGYRWWEGNCSENQ
jgi:hypothetical protein